MALQGAGPGLTVIDGGGIDRVFDVLGPVTVAIAGLTVRNGRLSGPPGVSPGGGIHNTGTLTLTDLVVSGNAADGSGGGIYNTGTLTVTNTTVSGNRAGLGGGGIYNTGTLTLSSATVTGNSAVGVGGVGNEGGGIHNDFAWLTVVNSTISNNVGGGIRNESGTLTISNSTVSGNTTILNGGGISNSGSFVLSNSTVSGNTGGPGGAIFNHGTLTVTNSTIATNTSSSSPGGILNLVPAALRNTIAANNVGGNCAGTGAVASQGHNLDSGTTCGLTGPGDLSSTDPLLGPLANNGGPTQTHALLSGSPAIDAGDNAGCPATDQRGVPRPQSVRCDIGAFERRFVYSGLTLNISLNKTTYVPGNVLQLNVTVANPTGPEVPVDVYFGFVLPPSVVGALGCPAGDLPAAFLTAGFATAELHCLSELPSSFPRLAQSAVPAGLPATVITSFFMTTVPSAPSGTYTTFLVLTVPNALVDDEIGPEDILLAAMAVFTIP